MRLRHVLPLLAVVCTSLFSSAQLDPRERYGTYLGGSKSVCTGDALGCGTSAAPTYAPATTYATAVVADAFGNVYVAGATDAIDFPTTTGAYHRTVNISNDDFGASHSDDTFITKFDSSGRVVWSTYLGIQTGILGGAPQNGGITGIAADAAGNTYVSGTSDLGGFGRYSSDTPFLLKLNASGSAVLYKNFIAAGCGDLGTVGTGEGIALDSAGFAYLVGADFYNCVNPTPAASQNGNSFVLKIDTTKAPAQSIVYAAKVFNFNPALYAHALAVNGSGNAYVTGDDEFVQELNSSGVVIFSTTVGYGGAATSIAVQNGLITLSGQGNPPGTANFGNDFNGLPNFIMRMNGSGSIVYSALIHDSNMTPKRLALDSAGEVFLTGRLNATQFRTDAYSNAPFSGAFLLRLNKTGTALMLHSAFGGDTGYGVAVDRAWNAFVVGGSISGEYYPLTSNAFQSSFKSAHAQGFFSKLIIEADVKMFIQGASPNPVKSGTNLTYSLAVFNNGPDVSDGDTITDVLPTGTTFVSFSTTNGSCSHPAPGSGGTFKCTRTGVLNKGSYWGPIKLTVHVNAGSGSTITNRASVAAKTQDVVPSNNTATVSVHVQ